MHAWVYCFQVRRTSLLFYGYDLNRAFSFLQNCGVFASFLLRFSYLFFSLFLLSTVRALQAIFVLLYLLFAYFFISFLFAKGGREGIISYIFVFGGAVGLEEDRVCECR